MSKITWEEFYSVNVKEIDDQHKRMVGFMNEAYEKLEKFQTLEPLTDFFQKLEDHANEHFATEEKYFKKYDFKFAPQHVSEHKRIVARIIEFQKRYDEAPTVAVIFEALQFLDHWLFDHIVKYDKKYTKCFNEHGLF